MDAGTFSDPAVIDVANQRYVPIRVDADRRPDVNERYYLGGWPTTSALTPDGDVLQGTTHLEPQEMADFLDHTADAWRDRGQELRARVRAARQIRSRSGSAADLASIDRLRSTLLAAFDPEYGGFNFPFKLAQTPAIRFAIARASEDSDDEMRRVAEKTLLGVDKLWDDDRGGFYRYAANPDWSSPGGEKTLEDNAAILEVLLDASIQLKLEHCERRAADLVRWVTGFMADRTGSGFFNSCAAGSHVVDVAMYVDSNAGMVSACLRAASYFDDPWLRDFALKSLEDVILSGYVPGGGVAHEHLKPGSANPATRGLLGDQVRTASALIWAHGATGRLPYSMLAVELAQFAIRTMWDEAAGCFRDRGQSGEDRGLLAEPVWPMTLNCEAAVVLDRLASLTGDSAYHDRAMAILCAFAQEYREYEVFGAPYALAVREVTEQRRVPALNLSRVEWHLEHD